MKKYKKIIISLLSLILIMPSKIYATRLMIEDEYLDVEIKKEDGRTLVPLRPIFEKLNISLEWNKDTKKIKGYFNDNQVEIGIDEKIAKLNNKDMELDIPARLINGKTFVPTRFIGELVGAEVQWDQASKTILINSDVRKINIRKKGNPYAYNLSNYDIEKAFEIGNKNSIDIWNYLLENYSLFKRDNQKTEYIEDISVLTPFHILITDVLKANLENKKLTLEDTRVKGKALNYLYRENGVLSFDMKILGETNDYNKDINVLLRQGDKYIRPFQIIGLDNKPKVRNLEQNSLNFETKISVSFIDTYYGKNKLNYSDPIEIHIIPKKGLTVVYDFDPYRYK